MFLLPENCIAESEYTNKDVTKQAVIFLSLLLSQMFMCISRYMSIHSYELLHKSSDGFPITNWSIAYEKAVWFFSLSTFFLF